MFYTYIKFNFIKLDLFFPTENMILLYDSNITTISKRITKYQDIKNIVIFSYILLLDHSFFMKKGNNIV